MREFLPRFYIKPSPSRFDGQAFFMSPYRHGGPCYFSWFVSLLFKSRSHFGYTLPLKSLVFPIQPPFLRKDTAWRHILLPDVIIEYIAASITANVRQLEGVIKRLTAYRDILNDDITKESVDRAIEDVTRNGTDIPNPDNIIRETAKYFSLKPEDLKGNNRSREIAIPRQISMYLLRQLTNLSLNDIGKELGRNHTTALSSIRKIEEMMRTDSEMTGVIRDITSNITTSSGSN